MHKKGAAPDTYHTYDCLMGLQPPSTTPLLAPRAPQVNRYNAILRKFAEAGSDEWDAIVSHVRGDLQRPFFEHVQV